MTERDLQEGPELAAALDSPEPEPPAEPAEPPRRRRGRPPGRRAEASSPSFSAVADSGSAPARASAREQQRERNLDRIHDAAGQGLLEMGEALFPFLPLTGATLQIRSPLGAQLTRNLAEQEPLIYRWALRAIRYATWAQVASFAGTVCLAVAVDLGRVPVEHFIVQRRFERELAEIEKAQRDVAAQAGEPPRAAPGPPGWLAGASRVPG